MKFVIPLSLLLWITINVYSQSSPKNKFHLIRFFDDNDFINFRGSGTDRSYTNGLKIDAYYTKNVAPKFFSRLLVTLNKESENLYGIGLTQLMFTPSDIAKTWIIAGDQPYAGLLYFNHSLVSSDYINNERLTTEIDIGVIGPASFARTTQTWIHEQINAQKPMGWNNQVDNDIIINYLIRYEKLLIAPSEKLQVIGILEANAGSLSNNLSTGLLVRAGIFNSYFSNFEKPGTSEEASNKTGYKKFQFFFFLRPTATAFMDNSVLQGGMFTGRTSPYIIKSDDLTRVFMQFETGIVIGHKNFGLSISEKMRSAEFKNAVTQQVGNIIVYMGI
jgi:lipid A 3-O-deacylase